MVSVFQVIKFLGDEQDQITFVTRAVRVVDLITNLDMAAFQSHSGLSIFICRLEVSRVFLSSLSAIYFYYYIAIVCYLFLFGLLLLAPTACLFPDVTTCPGN